MEEIIGRFGKVKQVILKPRGYALVEMETENEAKEIVERYDGEQLDGNVLKVAVGNMADETSESDER